MLSILIPYAPSTPERDRNFRWTLERWAQVPAEVVIGVPSGFDGNPGSFDHCGAINNAAAKATGDVLLVADADNAVDPAWLLEAVHVVTVRRTWALASCYLSLGESLTTLVLAGHDLPRVPGEDAEPTTASVAPPLVVTREAFEAVGGYDERNIGWAGDDICMACALDTLWGARTRVVGYAYHLWHPSPSEHNYGRDDFAGNRALYERYQQASGDPVAMRALIAERAT